MFFVKWIVKAIAKRVYAGLLGKKGVTGFVISSVIVSNAIAAIDNVWNFLMPEAFRTPDLLETVRKGVLETIFEDGDKVYEDYKAGALSDDKTVKLKKEVKGLSPEEEFKDSKVFDGVGLDETVAAVLDAGVALQLSDSSQSPMDDAMMRLAFLNAQIARAKALGYDTPDQNDVIDQNGNPIYAPSNVSSDGTRVVIGEMTLPLYATVHALRHLERALPGGLTTVLALRVALESDPKYLSEGIREMGKTIIETSYYNSESAFQSAVQTGQEDM